MCCTVAKLLFFPLYSEIYALSLTIKSKTALADRIRKLDRKLLIPQVILLAGILSSFSLMIVPPTSTLFLPLAFAATAGLIIGGRLNLLIGEKIYRVVKQVEQERAAS